MAVLYTCEGALDALEEKLAPITERITERALRPVSIGFTGDQNFRISFASRAGVEAYRQAIASLEPSDPLKASLEKRSPELRVAIRGETRAVLRSFAEKMCMRVTIDEGSNQIIFSGLSVANRILEVENQTMRSGAAALMRAIAFDHCVSILPFGLPERRECGWVEPKPTQMAQVS